VNGDRTEHELYQFQPPGLVHQMRLLGGKLCRNTVDHELHQISRGTPDGEGNAQVSDGQLHNGGALAFTYDQSDTELIRAEVPN
jgi:hypothetical protein